MDLVESLLSYFKNNAEPVENVPQGLCPNCWGNQEYDHKIRQMYKDQQVDVNNHKAHYAFIQDFVVKEIQGIKLQSEKEGTVCPRCMTEFSE